MDIEELVRVASADAEASIENIIITRNKTLAYYDDGTVRNIPCVLDGNSFDHPQTGALFVQGKSFSYHRDSYFVSCSFYNNRNDYVVNVKFQRALPSLDTWRWTGRHRGFLDDFSRPGFTDIVGLTASGRTTLRDSLISHAARNDTSNIVVLQNPDSVEHETIMNKAIVFDPCGHEPWWVAKKVDEMRPTLIVIGEREFSKMGFELLLNIRCGVRILTEMHGNRRSTESALILRSGAAHYFLKQDKDDPSQKSDDSIDRFYKTLEWSQDFIKASQYLFAQQDNWTHACVHRNREIEIKYFN